MDWEVILSSGIKSTFFALLSLYLLKRMFEKQDEREETYFKIIETTNEIIKQNQKIVDKLSDKYEDLKCLITRNFDRIEEKIERGFSDE